MRALITAGGSGTRLRPITHTINKHLVPICNKPLLFRAIENVAHLGIVDVIICINQGDRELKRVVGNGERWDVKITYVEQDEPRGLAQVIQLSQPYLEGDTFVFYYGDNVLAGGLERHAKFFLDQKSNCHLCLVKVEKPEQFGVAVIRDGHVVRTVEKPQSFISDLAITGIQFYDASIFEAIKHVKPTPPKPPRTIAEMDIPPANQWLIDHNYKVTYSEITAWWKDTGKPDDLLEANKLLLERLERKVDGSVDPASILDGKVEIGCDSVITNSTIKGPVIIGENCCIENCSIGPYTSIANRAKLKDVSINNSLILAESRIEHIDKPITYSIFGEGATLCENPKEKDNHSLILGDHSLVELG